MIGTVGQVCRVINEPDYAIKNIGLFKTRDKTLSVFAYYYFKSTFFQQNLLRSLSGTTQKYVSLKYLRNLRLPDCNNEKVIKWIESEVRYDRLINENSKHLSLSKKLQKSLINEIFSS